MTTKAQFSARWYVSIWMTGGSKAITIPVKNRKSPSANKIFWNLRLSLAITFIIALFGQAFQAERGQPAFAAAIDKIPKMR